MIKSLLLSVLAVLGRMGAPGLFLVGILDSSFLFLPFGNDLLILGFAARHPPRLAWYAACAALGSAVGCLLIDAVARKGGEEGLSRFVPARRAEKIKRKVRAHAAWALALSAILPPPFPFTPFVAVAAALQYPRWRMLAVLLPARMLRFCAIGVLSIAFGRRILALAEAPAVQYGLIGLLLVCVTGSVFSAWKWLHSPRH